MMGWGRGEHPASQGDRALDSTESILEGNSEASQGTCPPDSPEPRQGTSSFGDTGAEASVDMKKPPFLGGVFFREKSGQLLAQA